MNGLIFNIVEPRRELEMELWKGLKTLCDRKKGNAICNQIIFSHNSGQGNREPKKIRTSWNRWILQFVSETHSNKETADNVFPTFRREVKRRNITFSDWQKTEGCINKNFKFVYPLFIGKAREQVQLAKAQIAGFTSGWPFSITTWVGWLIAFFRIIFGLKLDALKLTWNCFIMECRSRNLLCLLHRNHTHRFQLNKTLITSTAIPIHLFIIR